MKLTDVARASLSELRGDYEVFILDRGQLPWSVHSPEAKAVNAISLDSAPFTDDMVHESAKHALEPKERAFTRKPAVRQAHAPTKVGQRRFLGMLHLPRLQRNTTDMKATLTPSTMRSTPSTRSCSNI